MNDNLFTFILGAFIGLAGASSLFVLVWKNTKQIRAKAPPPQKPDEYIIVVKIDLQQELGAQYYKRFDLPIPWDRMVALAKAVANRGYVWNFNLTGRQAGNPVTRGEYAQLTQLFMEEGIIRPKLTDADPRVGHYVTHAGRSYFRYWSDLPALSREELKDFYTTQAEAQEGAGAQTQGQRSGGDGD